VLFTYDGEDSNTVTILSKGTGSVDAELVPILNDKVVAYGLARKVEQIDKTEAVKFVFIRFVGNNINRMLKARLGTHFGTITAFFNPYHVSIDITEPNEVSDEIIMRKITFASGTRVHVLDQHQSYSQQQRGAQLSSSGSSGNLMSAPRVAPSTKLPAVPKTIASTSQAIQLRNEDEIKANIKDVRNDASETDWCLVGYEGGKGNALISLAKGTGGIAAILEHLQDNIVVYGLVRKEERIDKSITVKFAHIVWIGDNIDRMHRARLGTHKGAVQALFLPYHVDITVSQKSELSDEVIVQKIAEASGTAKKVKD